MYLHFKLTLALISGLIFCHVPATNSNRIVRQRPKEEAASASCLAAAAGQRKTEGDFLNLSHPPEAEFVIRPMYYISEGTEKP